MPSSNTHTTYGTVTKSFHWLTALLILAIIPLGVVANDAPYTTNAELAFKATLFSIHKTFGVAVFFVALARIIWALTQTKPAPLHPDRKSETLLAEVIHWALYLSLVIVPLSGWIDHAATTGFAPIWWPFGQSLPFVPKDENVAHFFAGLHWVFGKVMVAAILLHIAGAAKHQIIDRDATLRRMWFGHSKAHDLQPHHGSLLPPVLAIGIFVIATAAAGAAGMFRVEGPRENLSLTQVSSDWQVTSGTLAITVTQLGSPVTGAFADWTAAISFDPTPAEVMGQIAVTINIGSLTLGSVTAQAMGPDFFDQANFATADFVAEIKPDGTGFVADGTLTLKGTTVPVQLPFSLDLLGDMATVQAALNLDRLAFGIGTNMPDESNLGFGVDVTLEMKASRQ